VAKLLKQSSTAQPLVFLMVQSADHVTPLTGATCTVTLSKNGGSFASPSGAVSEIANGWYKVAGNATDTGTLGPLILHATAASGDPTDVLYEVVAFDPQVATNLGLSALPTAAAGASGGLPTGDNSGGVTVGAYESGKDPATLLLVTPANKVQTNATGQVQLAHDQAVIVPPKVVFSGGSPTKAAIAIPKIVAGVITGIVIVDGGAYGGTPTASITAGTNSAGASVGSGAVLGTVVLTGGAVSSVPVSNGGTLYQPNWNSLGEVIQNLRAWTTGNEVILVSGNYAYLLAGDGTTPALAAIYDNIGQPASRTSA
jgi:hypothetical protein